MPESKKKLTENLKGEIVIWVITLGVSVITMMSPIIKLNTTITELNTTLKNTNVLVDKTVTKVEDIEKRLIILETKTPS